MIINVTSSKYREQINNYAFVSVTNETINVITCLFAMAKSNSRLLYRNECVCVCVYWCFVPHYDCCNAQWGRVDKVHAAEKQDGRAVKLQSLN